MSLQIIGAGFGRTGTKSLKLALEALGFAPCHHFHEVRDNPEQLAHWQAAARGEAADWDAALRGYVAQVDWPGARYWRELVRQYPDAKVILTIRDPDAWFDSMQATIIPFIEGRGSHPSAHANAMAEWGHFAVDAETFGSRLSERDHATRVFGEHVATVEAEIAADRLLVFDVRAGWAPLCRFLGVDAPGVPFPWVNSSKQFIEVEWKGETVAG